MLRVVPPVALGIAVAAGLGACGSTHVLTQTVTQQVTAPQVPKDVGSTPGLLRQARRPGEILVQGNTSPKSFGPYDFEPGLYTFRFEQYAPGISGIDFATDASSITVALNRKPRVSAADSELLVNATQKQGDNNIYASGKYFVDVTSADYSYVLTFTRRR
ncbi:MAG: hypothetical protein ACJ77M_05190 [Thermoleophilaceae bacterium]